MSFCISKLYHDRIKSSLLSLVITQGVINPLTKFTDIPVIRTSYRWHLIALVYIKTPCIMPFNNFVEHKKISPMAISNF